MPGKESIERKHINLLKLRSLLQLDRPQWVAMANVNSWSCGYVATVPAMAGSLLTGIYYGVAGWCILNALTRRYTLSIPARSMPFVIACASCFAVFVFTGLIANHPERLPTDLEPMFAMAVIAPVIARYRFAMPERALYAMCLYAPLGAIGGLITVILAGPSGGAGNANVLATAMVVISILCLAGTFHGSRREQAFGLIGFGFAAVAIIMSGMRASYPFIVLLPLMAAMISRRVDRRLLTLIVLVCLVVVATNFRFLSDQILTIADDFEQLRMQQATTTLTIRIKLWAAALEASRDHLIFGHGLQNKMDAVRYYLDPRYLVLSFSHVHNAYLDALVAAGLVGVIALVATLLTPLLMVVGRPAPSQASRFICYAIVIVFAVRGLFGNMITHDLLVVLFLFPLALVAASDPEDRVIVLLRGRALQGETDEGISGQSPRPTSG